jgi:hypothetical protein
MEPAWTTSIDQDQARLSVSSAGDVNADGFDDVVLGCPSCEFPTYWEGVVLLFLGSPSGLGTDPAWIKQGNVKSGAFGDGVSNAGDVNGDGFDDVAVGDSASGERVQVFLGTASGLRHHPSTSLVVTGGQARGVLIFSGAGDVNGDGFDEVIVGAPYYPTGNTGTGGALVWYGRPLG